MRGSAFLSATFRAQADAGLPGASIVAGAGGAKVIGNGLRELDRFLSLLADEAAAALAPAGFDRPAFARHRNVANKLGVVHALAGGAMPGRERLRAIGRVRDCLHHCRGVVHDQAVRGDLSLASGEPGGAPAQATALLAVSFEELARICRFYAEAGAEVIAACDAGPAVR